MTLEEIGKLLKETRERKKLSLESIRDKTKISVYILEAIEAGNANLLPPPIYTKGFILAYANELGLDGKELITTYSYSSENNLKELKPLNQVEEPKHKYWLWLLLCILLIAGIFWGKYFLNHPQKRVVTTQANSSQNSSQNQTQSLSNHLKTFADSNASTHNPKPGNQKQEVLPSSNSNASVNQQTNVSANLTKLEQTQVVSKTRETSHSPQQNLLTSSAPLAESKPVLNELNSSLNESNSSFNSADQNELPLANKTQVETKAKLNELKIIAKDMCWTRIYFDDQVKTYLLQPGDEKILHFKNKARIKLGNAGGVQIFLNGQEISTGKLGEVKTIELP